VGVHLNYKEVAVHLDYKWKGANKGRKQFFLLHPLDEENLGFEIPPESAPKIHRRPSSSELVKEQELAAQHPKNMMGWFLQVDTVGEGYLVGYDKVKERHSMRVFKENTQELRFVRLRSGKFALHPAALTFSLLYRIGAPLEDEMETE